MADQEEQTGGTSLWTKIKWGIYAVIGIWILFSLFSDKDGSSSNSVTYEEEVILEPSEGIVTKLDEVQAEVFQITDEEVVPTKADSRIIATYMTGEIDTFTLEEVALVDTTITDRSDSRYRSRFIRSAVMGGAMGYLMGRSMRSPLRRSSYRSDNAFNKSKNTTKSRMTSSATRKTVRKPVARKSTGFGKKSTRSYGG